MRNAFQNITHTRDQYMRGMWTPEEAETWLHFLGCDEDIAAAIVRRWNRIKYGI